MSQFLFRDIRDDECRDSIALYAKDPDNHVETWYHVANGSKTKTDRISASWSLAATLSNSENHSELKRIAIIDLEKTGVLPEDCTGREKEWTSVYANNFGNKSQEAVFTKSVPEEAIQLLLDDKDIAEIQQHLEKAKAEYTAKKEGHSFEQTYRFHFLDEEDINVIMETRRETKTTPDPRAADKMADAYIAGDTKSKIVEVFQKDMTKLSETLDKGVVKYLQEGNLPKAKALTKAVAKEATVMFWFGQEEMHVNKKILFKYEIPKVEHEKYRCTEPEQAQQQWQQLYDPQATLSDQERFELEMVQDDPTSIELIENPCELVQLEAIRQNPNLIEMIKNPTEKVQELASQSPMKEYFRDVLPKDAGKDVLNSIHIPTDVGR